MGGKQSVSQERVDTQACGSHYACPKVRTTEYGSWTKLSLDLDASLFATQRTSTNTSPVNLQQEHTDSGSSCSNSNQDSGSSRASSPEDEVSVTTCTQILTRPPSQQHDVILSKVAGQLIDVEADVTATQKAPLATSSPVLPSQNRNPQGHPKAAKPPAHYSLNLSSISSSAEEGAKRDAISRALLRHFDALTSEMKPEEVASKLYGIAILDDGELEQASDPSESVEDRAWALLELVKKKLQQNPGLFVEICKIFRACHIRAITQVIDDMKAECPSEDFSILSYSGSLSDSVAVKSSSSSRTTTCCHDTFSKLEESFRSSGLLGATEYVEKLRSEKADVSLIHEACLANVDVSTLDLLLSILSESSHDINTKNKCGQTPLHVACASLRQTPASTPTAGEATNDPNVEQRLKIEQLLSHNASNWIKDKDDNTPLHLAVLRNDSESVSMLLKAGVKRCLNSVNKLGNTALHLACKQGSVDIVKILCSYSADTSFQNKKMRTALHLACLNDHVEVAVLLASHDPSTLDAFDRHRMTPLHICCKKGSEPLTLPLLQLKNCYLCKTDEDDRTVLHYACMCGNLALVSALLQKDSSKNFLDLQDLYGDTALHIASRLGYKDVVKELLGCKASIEIVNQEGKTPMDIAEEGEHGTIARKMLRKRGGWGQRRRRAMMKVRKLRRTQTEASLVSSVYQSELSDLVENSSDESGDDETVGEVGGAMARRVTF